MKITDVSIDNRTSIFVLVFILVIVGLSAYFSLPRESSPDIQIPFVLVSTPYFGVSPEDMESLITQPLEKELNTIKEVKELTSTSYEGFSIIQAEFESGFDIDEALQKVREKVDKALPELPADVERPNIIEINLSEFPILTFNIAGPVGLVKLKDIAEDLKDKIEKIDGILEVQIRGGLEREVQVNVDINKLQYYNVRFDDIIEGIQGENRTIPGGSIDLEKKSFLVRVPGEYEDPYLIKDIVVKLKEGKPIYIKDIAEVIYDFKDRTGYARHNMRECVTVSVVKRSGANIISIADQVKAIIADADETYPETIKFGLTADESKEIKSTVKNLENNIYTGLVLVLGVLLFFLGFRNALFVAVAIPLSMLLSFIILQAFGITLNMIVLFSLILALGMLVDNAIVIIENIHKFLEEGHSLVMASKKGAAEVAWPITTSTLTTLAAFGPMLFWPGIIGDFMGYLPLTVIIVLASSLIVALIMNPVFASKYMKIEHPDDIPVTLFQKAIHPLNKLTHFFVDIMLPKVLSAYENILLTAMGEERNPNKPVNRRNLFGLAAMFIIVILLIAGVNIPAIPNELVLIVSLVLGIINIYIFTSPKLRVMAGTLLGLVIIILTYREFDHGVEFFPSVDPPVVSVNIESPSGTTLDMSNMIAHRIESRLKKFYDIDVKDIVTNVGSSNNAFDGSSTPNKTVISIQYKDYEDRIQSSLITTDQIREALSDIAGAEIEVKQQEMGPPVGAAVNIEIIGDNYNTLGGLAEKVRREISDIEGVVDLKDNYDSGRPEVRVQIDREKAALHALSTSLIASTIRTAINGTEASSYRVEDEEYDITVRLKKDQRSNISDLENIQLIFNDKKGTTKSIPIKSVADISDDKGPSAIRRKDMKRVVTVSANVAEGSNANEVLSIIKERLSNFGMPQDYYIEYTGQEKEQAEAGAFLGKAFMVAFLLIFLILVIQFNSLSQPFIIMAAVTISLIGVFLGLIVFSMPFGIIMSGIGVISLAGVVVNNNIVLVDYMNILIKKDYTVRNAVIQAGIRRFRPVTLTAITTILGIIPLTFGFGFDFYSFSFEFGGVEGEFWRQMGVSMIFGLAFGTVLTLVIVPVIITSLNDALSRVKVIMSKKASNDLVKQ